MIFSLLATALGRTGPDRIQNVLFPAGAVAHGENNRVYDAGLRPA